MRTAGSVICLMAVVAVCRLMIHVIGVVAAACVGPRRCAASIRGTALSIRAIIHHAVVVIVHLEVNSRVSSTSREFYEFCLSPPVNNFDRLSM